MPVIWRAARRNSTEIAGNANYSQCFSSVCAGLHAALTVETEGHLASGRAFCAISLPCTPQRTHAARRFCVAPMMEWTDRHCRFFHRLLTRQAVLYTEMITTGAVIHGDRERLLGFDAFEHPVALQLGGSDPRQLAESARIARGFRLSRNQSQCRLPVRPRAGRPLRRLPDGRARSGRRLRRGDESPRCAFPVTVKCRIGIDDQDPEAIARRVHAKGEGGRRRCADRACAQGLARRIVAAREPRHPAARL